MAKTNRKKKMKKKYFRYFVYLIYIVSIITLILLFLLDLIPVTYYLLLILFVFIFNLLLTFLLLGKSWKKRLFGTLVSVVYLLIMFFVSSYSFNTLDFLNSINNQDYNTENYSVVVLKSSMFDKIKDLKGEDIGYISAEEDVGSILAKKQLKKKVKANFIEYENLSNLVTDFLNEEVEAILIEDSEKSILEEEYDNFVINEKILITHPYIYEKKSKLLQ